MQIKTLYVEIMDIRDDIIKSFKHNFNFINMIKTLHLFCFADVQRINYSFLKGNK